MLGVGEGVGGSRLRGERGGSSIGDRSKGCP